MLTRLKVSGFKNLVDVDVRFGPFTCIAGPNGVGKSNLLDAITFLSALVDKPLVDAALSIRDESGPEQSLLFAYLKEYVRNNRRFHGLAFACLPKTWRTETGKEDTIPKGELLAFLNPIVGQQPFPFESRPPDRRVIDREDLQMDLPLQETA